MNNAAKIQQEIYANGSVEAMFVLHKDLYKYQGGVYIVGTTYLLLFPKTGLAVGEQHQQVLSLCPPNRMG